MTTDYLLQMENITKTFPGTKALDNVSLRVRKGSVHALVGENGAGKSTIMKVLIGLYRPDSGSIQFNGKQLNLKNVNDSIQNGISMIQQELSAVPDMTVAENIFLGKEIVKKMNLVDDRRMIKLTKELMDRLDIDINPNTKMRYLSVANKQMVEIAKAISYDSELVIMDEPTSALTEKEVEHLYKIIHVLKEEGRSIIYITHKLDEIFEVCDEATVLRDGQFIGSDLIANLSKDTLIKMMVGRELKEFYYKENNTHGEVALRVEGLTVDGLFKDVSFTVRQGEILGLAGLLGAGRTEVIETIYGLHKPNAGEVFVEGKKLSIHSPEEAIKHGMGMVTEDRKLTGLFPPLNVKENMSMAGLFLYVKNGFVDDKKLLLDCNKQIRDLRIKTMGAGQIVNDLSGGNQQKILIARWMMIAPRILFLDEPTRGIDVHSKAEIYKLINQMAKNGTAIVLVSSEMPELLGMCDKIMVMHEGTVSGELQIQEATQLKILTLCMGEEPPSAAD